MKWYERSMDTVHDENNIKGFFEDFRWLSNYHECPVILDGLLFDSSEAAHQAAKTLNMAERKTFLGLSAGDSKKQGQKVQLRKDWEQVKVAVMFTLLMDKFTRNPELGQKLLETGEKFLEETNWWNDQFWGVCNGEGRNELGIQLMNVRAKLKHDSEQ